MVGFDRWYQAVSRSGSAYRRVLEAAFGQDQFVGQQGFSSRDQLLALGAAALRDSDGPLLDVCCGAGGPAECIAAQLGTRVIGVDLSLPALRLARLSTVAGDAAKLPFSDGSFGAALLLDSLASVQALDVLFAEVARVLRPGGGLGVTAEVGRPLSSTERARFTRSAPPTVVEEHTLRACLAGAGFATADVSNHTPRAAAVAHGLVAGLTDLRDDLVKELGQDAVEDLTATLSCLADLLSSRRVSEIALVARRAT